jgi:MFS family permease
LNLQEVLAASGLLYGLALVMTLVGISSAPAMDREWDLITPLRQIVRQPGFLPVTVGLLGATLLWGTLQAYLPLYGKEVLSLPAAQIGYMIAIQAVANGLARIPGGRLVDRTRRRGWIVIVGLSVFALCLALLPHLTGFWPTTLLLVASVPVLATVYIALSVVFTNLATEETRGVTMGIYGSVLYLGLGAGPVIFGTVMERSGYVAGFTACAVTGLLLAGLVAVLRSEPLRRRSSAAMPPA